MSQKEETKPMSKATGVMKFYNIEHLEKLRVEKEEETPRGSAVLGHAYLEELLGELLIKRFVNGEELQSKIKYLSFRDKLELCYQIGLISNTIKKDLFAVNEIRNAFAHKKEVKDFNQEDIPSKCDALLILKVLQKETKMQLDELPPGKKYHITVNFLWFLLEERLKSCTKIEEWSKPF